MTAFFLFDVRHIRDEDTLAEYRRQVFETVERFGGRYRVLGGPFEVLEGEWAPVIPVLIEFPTVERARQWYESDVYRPLRDLRLRAADCSGVLIEGFEHVPETSGGR